MKVHFNLKRPAGLLAVVMLVALVLAACQPEATSIPTAAATATSAPKPTNTTAPVATATVLVPQTGGTAAGAATVMVATDPKLGKILVDGKGMTLYMFTKDAPDKSNCEGGCLKAWPPLLTDGAPVAGEGADASMLGTTKMADGSTIVTYNHMPLYYWAKDTKPGDTTGQGVNDVWYVVGPDAMPIGMPAASATTPATAGTVMVATDPKLGKILVDSKGMTLYMFTKDEADKSNCSGGCLKAWPPLLADGAPTAGEGVDAAQLGTAALADGTKIVTYNHMPLYYWAKDTKPGDTTGQGVNDVWYVVAPDGKPVGMPAAASTLMVAKDPILGSILVDGKGMTLYMFTKDEPDKSNCSGGCLAAWPPFLADGAPVAGAGVDSTLIGTAALPDGTKILTYNHMPLYYWAADLKPGDTSGQGVNSVWYVVAPDGKPVGMPQSSVNPYGSDY